MERSAGKNQVIEHPLELDLWNETELILGMDEAGRGCLCGPVVIAGVIFPKGYENTLIDDSKKLSEKKREKLYSKIRQDALAYQVIAVSAKRIDEINILEAVREAMNQIAFNLKAELTLSDAVKLDPTIRHEAIIKGDQKSISIAAASILAKVTRDRIMLLMDQDFPGYNLKKHKGYPTKEYLSRLSENGIHPYCRLSYKPIQKLLFNHNDNQS